MVDFGLSTAGISAEQPSGSGSNSTISKINAFRNFSEVTIRILDQAAWSAGFFGFNLAASIVLEVSHFAALSIVTAVAFIVIATLRAWEINSRVVAGSIEKVRPPDTLSISSAIRSSIVYAVVSSGLLVTWLILDGLGSLWIMFSVLGALIVVSDLPRQILIMQSSNGQSFTISIVYAIGGAAALVAVLLGSTEEELFVLWIFALLVVSLVGWTSLRRSESVTIVIGHGSYKWRMFAEAGYLGLGSQFSILILFFISDQIATTGIRLSYVLVFAPAFMIVQGLQPLIMKRMAEYVAKENAGRKTRTISVVWQTTIAVLILCCGLTGELIDYVWPDSPLSGAIQYLLPVGLSVAGSQIFDAALLEFRFRAKPSLIHAIRLWSVFGEIALLAGGAYIAGSSGVVFGLILTGILKLGASALLSLAHSWPGTRISNHA